MIGLLSLPVSAWRLVPPALAAILLAACSGEEAATPDRSTGAAGGSTFGAAERAAARALSIGRTDVLAGVESPYTQALLCSTAVEAFGERLRGSAILNAEQGRALAAAKAHFDGQARSLAQAQGRSPDVVAQDRRQAAADVGDGGEAAQMFVACLRSLEQGA